ncbi:MAG: extracellular solute-binding protein [Acidimicrobiales bacterium]
MKASNPSRWKTRTALRLLVAVATIGAGGTLVALTGAASSASTVAHSTPTVTLQFWNAYNDVTETPVMNGVVIPSFESQNPGIKVVDDTLPYAGLLQKFIASSAAGDPPDLMRSDIAWVPQLASEGTLLETSTQPWFAPVKAAADPGPLSTNYWNGGYYGLPDDTNTQVFFWNKADFAAAKLSPPTTWGQMIADAKLLTIPSKQQHGLGVDSTDIWNVGPYVWTYGGNFTNKALTKATGYMNSPQTEGAVQTLVTLYKEGVIGSDFVGGSGSISGETGFPTGAYAMYLDGPWATTTYREDKFTGYGTSLIPRGAGGSTSVVGGEDLVIAKGGKHLADTIKFVQFLQSPFAQLAMAGAGDMAAYKTDSAAEAIENPALKIFAQELLTARARPVTQGYAELDTDFSNELALMLAGKVSVDQGLNTAAQEANKALASTS